MALILVKRLNCQCMQEHTYI